MSESPSTTEDSTEVVQKEFLFFSLPYVYFIGAAMYRIQTLKPPQMKSNRQSIAEEGENKEATFPPSLAIKLVLTIWLCFICGIQMMLGFFGLL